MSPKSLKTAATTALLLSSNLAAAANPTAGDFSILSFNVAGLPSILQDNGETGSKETNSGLIGAQFGAYGFDAIHVQEDFNYHAYICRSAVWSFLFLVAWSRLKCCLTRIENVLQTLPTPTRTGLPLRAASRLAPA